MLIIKPIEAFSDNYIWLLYREGERAAWVVDPGDAQPVLDALSSLGLDLQGVLVTHHHFDHVGGLARLCEDYQLTIYGPHNPAIAQLTQRLQQGDRVEVLGETFDILEVPGHTLDHIAYHAPGASVLFCGDTLFAGGCGRVFEGTPQMMYRTLHQLTHLPAQTRLYCAHEYTLANLAFARAVEPDNDALARRIEQAEASRAKNIPTVPSELALELATNPFLRCTERDVIAAAREREGALGPEEPEGVFAAIRGWKDNF